MMNPFTALYLKANHFDHERGRDAYLHTQYRCTRLAEHYGVSPITTYALFAVLSPNNAESSNWQALETILSCHKRKTISKGAGVPAYGRDQYKAWRLLLGRELPQDVLTSPKIWNFYRCILDPYDPEPVTVDGHMVNIHDDRPDRRLTEVDLTGDRYREIAELVRQSAQDLRDSPLPSQVQSVCWYTWKRIHNLTYDWTRITAKDQLHLFGDPGGPPTPVPAPAPASPPVDSEATTTLTLLRQSR